MAVVEAGRAPSRKSTIQLTSIQRKANLLRPPDAGHGMSMEAQPTTTGVFTL